MANAAILYDNLAKTAAIQPSSQEINMPAELLLDPHVQNRWRSLTGSASFVADLGSLVSIDTAGVFGLTGGASTVVRIRLSATDDTGLTGDAGDTGGLVSGSAYFDHRYGSLVWPKTAAASCRYVRVDITDPDAGYVEAGRIVAGVRTVFAHNFGWDWSLGRVDRSARQKSRGGQTHIWNDNAYRVLGLRFPWVTEAQRYGLVETIDLLNGQHDDVLFMTDPSSTNVARDSIWGLITESGPNTLAPGLTDVFGKQYTIEERL